MSGMYNMLARTSITLCILISASIAYGQDMNTLPEPGLTPESPFYFLDRFDERLRLSLTFDDTKRLQRRILIAEERLSEGRSLAGKGIVAVERALDLYVATMSRVYGSAYSSTSEVRISFVAERISFHIRILEEISERTSAEKKQFVLDTVETSIDAHASILLVLLDVNPEEAHLLLGRNLTERMNRILDVAIDIDNSNEALKSYAQYVAGGEKMLKHTPGTSIMVGGTNASVYLADLTSDHLTTLNGTVRSAIKPQAEEDLAQTIFVLQQFRNEL